MVCNRCIMAVENELRKLGLKAANITLGEAELQQELSPQEKNNLATDLATLGFELIDDKKSRIIEKIKNIIIDIVHHREGGIDINLSEVLAKELHHDYKYLSNLFSEVEGSTIEKYFIAQKIEKVKELLVYDELNLTEIADKMHYSSVAHLSNQFKKMTGLTPSHFKKLKNKRRNALGKV